MINRGAGSKPVVGAPYFPRSNSPLPLYFPYFTLQPFTAISKAQCFIDILLGLLVFAEKRVALRPLLRPLGLLLSPEPGGRSRAPRHVGESESFTLDSTGRGVCWPARVEVSSPSVLRHRRGLRRLG